jgi:hypothetical protein
VHQSVNHLKKKSNLELLYVLITMRNGRQFHTNIFPVPIEAGFPETAAATPRHKHIQMMADC